MKKNNPKFRLISLFSGAGGMDIGFDRTGKFELLACIENVPVFAQTLMKNRDAGRLGSQETKVINADIATVDPRKLIKELNLKPGDLDVLAGGPPCQSFSTAGKRGTVQDRRGLLLWEFMRFVEVFQPKYFVMENVRGLLSAALEHRPIKARPEKGGEPLKDSEQPGSVVNLWLADLKKATRGTYRVDCFEVNAVNYGSPQIRERVLFFGNNCDRLIDFPQPTHGNPLKEKLIDGKKPFATLGEALDSVTKDDGEIMDFSSRKKSFLQQVPEGSNWRALPESIQEESMGKAWYAKGGRSGWWRRLTRELPSPTVVTMPNHASTAMCHPTETRALTLKECAAIQGFPSEWEFKGTTQQKYTQVGNALPTRLAEVAAEVLVNELEKQENLHSSALPSYRRVYLNSHVRTRQWFKRGETLFWKSQHSATKELSSEVLVK